MIHREKLEKARELLACSSLNINEISQMCGYPSLQYFYSVFKKSYATTPKRVGSITVRTCSNAAEIKILPPIAAILRGIFKEDRRLR